MITVYLHIPFGRSMFSYQDSANNLTQLCYSSKTRRFRNYLCMNQWKSRPSYSTRVRVEYLTFMLKNSPNIWYSTRYSTRYLTRSRVNWPWSNNFTIRLRLDLGHQLLVFASMTISSWDPASPIFAIQIPTLYELLFTNSLWFCIFKFTSFFAGFAHACFKHISPCLIISVEAFFNVVPSNKDTSFQ